MRNPTVEDKVTNVFKAFVVINTTHFSLVISILAIVIKELNNIQKEFIWRCKKS